MRKQILVALTMLVGGLGACAVSGVSWAASAAAALPSDTPPSFHPNTDSFDFVKREEMVPMRDGVRLKTFILIPKGATHAPMLLTRTPYNAGERVARNNSSHLAAVVPQMDDTAVAAGYIIVFQDVRGKYGSQGDYVMTRPLHGPQNPTAIDHSTDTFDTIDWLVKHVPESNGWVGTIGGSYEGFTAVISTVNPHPALKVAVPLAPMIDGWMGDDWFHNGAFRQDGSPGLHLRSGSDTAWHRAMVERAARYLPGISGRRFRRRHGGLARPGSTRLLARAGRTHSLRCLLARSGAR